ncbi:MAG: thioredoxin family protein [Planctomycetota bacterium]|nr:MAG: thioredoxin family protein [Planctomycetota bacterium]
MVSRGLGWGLLLLVAAGGPAAAQSEARKRRNLERKLAMDWVTLAEWTFDYEEALSVAAEEGKVVFAYFTRSDRPSAYCLKYEQELLTDPDFVAFGDKVVLFAHVQSGLPEQKHTELLQEKGGSEPPYMVFLDAQGKVLGPPLGDTPEAVAASLPHAEALARLEGKAKSRAEKVALLVAEVLLGRVRTVAEAERRRRAIAGRTHDEDLAIDSAILNLRILSLLREKRVQNEAEAAALGERFYAWYRKGLRPARQRAAVAFWNMIRLHGKLASDPEIYAVGYEGMKSWYGGRPRTAAALRQMAEELEALRQGR